MAFITAGHHLVSLWCICLVYWKHMVIRCSQNTYLDRKLRRVFRASLLAIVNHIWALPRSLVPHQSWDLSACCWHTSLIFNFFLNDSNILKMECGTVLWRCWRCLRSCHSAHAWAHIWRGTVFLQLLHNRRTLVPSVYATISRLWNVLCSVAPCVIVRTEPKFGAITHQRHVCGIFKIRIVVVSAPT